ncbi:MAG: hypothetical protein QNJ81_09375 [Acidimicrobiia bacterium]|nr:hypothetical protein [Acidimicrobiia bacterium]
MSWDIFVQDLPAGITDVADIPSTFRPGPIGKHAEILAGIAAVAPDATFAEDGWGTIERDGFSIEINLSPDDPVHSFAFHVGGDAAAGDLIAEILDHLGLAALDPQAPGGVFSRDSAQTSFQHWSEYRDHALEE